MQRKILIILGLAFHCFTAAVADEPTGQTPRKATELTMDGSWSGIATFDDSDSRTKYPFLCSKMTAETVKANETCQYGSEKGQAYQVKLSCVDPYLSDAGKALFAHEMKVCQTIRSVGRVNGSFTMLTTQDSSGEFNLKSPTSASLLKVSASDFLRSPIRGASSIVVLSFRYSFNSPERYATLVAEFYRDASE